MQVIIQRAMPRPDLRDKRGPRSREFAEGCKGVLRIEGTHRSTEHIRGGGVECRLAQTGLDSVACRGGVGGCCDKLAELGGRFRSRVYLLHEGAGLLGWAPNDGDGSCRAV